MPGDACGVERATEGTDCEIQCGWLADCAVCEGQCPGYSTAEDRTAVYEGCLPTCAATPALAVVVANQTMCAQTVGFVSGQSEDFAASCEGGEEPAPEAFTQEEIQALMNTRCSPCHIAQASGGMSLANDFTGATVGIMAGEAPALKRIEPGSKEDSYLWHKISGTQVEAGGAGARMPLSGPPYLTDEEIARIGAWIDGL